VQSVMTGKNFISKNKKRINNDHKCQRNIFRILVIIISKKMVRASFHNKSLSIYKLHNQNVVNLYDRH